MPFDAAKFTRASLALRTASVELSALASFFDEGEKPEFTVRQLSGEELALCNEAVKANRDFSEILSQMMSSEPKEKADAVMLSLGRGSRVPDEIAKRIEMLVIASMEPQIDRETAIKLARNFPIEFYHLTNKITVLTGEGAVLGEASDSGISQPSESPVH